MTNFYNRPMRKVIGFLSLLAVALGVISPLAVLAATDAPLSGEVRPVVIANIDGPITPASDDYLKSALSKAERVQAQLLVITLNTPGGLLDSMQSMVRQLLESPVPTVVYVSPSGGGAISAGVFVTMAANFAVMAPGTTIGAAHPVLSSGGDVKGDMGAKIENFAATLIKAIAEQRGRNVLWAEEAVRESVAITDREAVEKRVIDFVASDLDRVLELLEGKTVNVRGTAQVLKNLRSVRRETIPMNLKQNVLNFLADPNIAMLLGLGALFCLGVEFYHPGAVLPGIVGVICLILFLTSGQILPINYGGAALMVLGFAFFIAEFFAPSFGIWGVSGIISLVLGAIYFIDADSVWSSGEFGVNRLMIGGVASVLGAVLFLLCYLAARSAGQKVATGKEGLVGKDVVVKEGFVRSRDNQQFVGRVSVMGEIWKSWVPCAVVNDIAPQQGDILEVVEMGEGMNLQLKPK